MGEPLQCLPQQPLKGPCGERLVLNRNTCLWKYHWINNIASKSSAEFLQAVHTLGPNPFHSRRYGGEWQWPAVVLTPEEYKLRVGGMSVIELQQQLENYWGQGGILGAFVGYQDIAVDTVRDDYITYRPITISHPFDEDTNRKRLQLDMALFRHWVNRECAQWLGYFIAKNHTLGAVHAWFAAFLGVTKESLPNIAKSFTNIAQFQDPESEAFMESIHRIKIRMSFDVCIEGHDEVVDSLPSLPSNTVITTKKGMQVIHDSINNMFPRRIWDICANTVIPAAWFCGPPCPLTGRKEVGSLGVKPVSHAWVSNDDKSVIFTEANQQMWPIPIPKGVLIEDIRGEMIRLGVRYAWLDVLCLRQRRRDQPTPATDLAIQMSIPPSTETLERREKHRLEEWKVDVPTIGAIYSNLDENGLYGDGPIIIFMSGLGRPFRDEGWDSQRHWLRRAWTIQESPTVEKCLIAGLPEGRGNWGARHTESMLMAMGQGTEDMWSNKWPWTCKV